MKVHTIIPTVLVKEAGIGQVLNAISRFGKGAIMAPIHMGDEIAHGAMGKGFFKRVGENADYVEKNLGSSGTAGHILGTAAIPGGLFMGLTHNSDSSNKNSFKDEISRQLARELRGIRVNPDSATNFK
jgi:hypothetical protein